MKCVTTRYQDIQWVMHMERKREAGRHGHRHRDKGAQCVWTQLSPKEGGERWGHYWKMAKGAEH